MELKEYSRILRDQWRVVLAVLLIVVSGTAVVTLLQTPRYTAETRLYFSLVGSESVTDVAQGGFFATAQMESYAQVSTSPRVLRPVADELRYPGGVEALTENTRATARAQTVLLDITVTDPDPVLAARAANAIGAQTISAVGELNSEGQSQIRVNAETIAEAEVPRAPSEPNPMRNLAAALAAGLLLGWGLAFLRTTLDIRVRTSEDIARITATVPSLGTVPIATTGEVTMVEAPRSVTAETYRRLATNLRFITADSGRGSALVTSSVQGEGKSTTAVNMAVAVAEAGSTVLLIDADLRAPQIAALLGLEGSAGLTTVLSGQATVDEVLQPSPSPRLDVLAAGQLPPNPSGLLGSRRMQELLDWAETNYDVTIIDSPPLLPVTDAAVLAPQVGNRVLVMRAGKVTRPQVQEALDSLARVESPANGYILNGVQQPAAGVPYAYGTRAAESAAAEV